MASNGIRDRVAIVGMGCTPFGEHWDLGLDDLIVAPPPRLESAGVGKDDIDAYWVGTAQGGMWACARPSRSHINDKPVTRVENMCATGIRGAAAGRLRGRLGAYDTAMALGVEKVKDGGYQGLNAIHRSPTDGTARTLTAASMFSMVVPAYAENRGSRSARSRR